MLAKPKRTDSSLLIRAKHLCDAINSIIRVKLIGRYLALRRIGRPDKLVYLFEMMTGIVQKWIREDVVVHRIICHRIRGDIPVQVINEAHITKDRARSGRCCAVEDVDAAGVG